MRLGAASASIRAAMQDFLKRTASGQEFTAAS
jgi:hypothetical protein